MAILTQQLSHALDYNTTIDAELQQYHVLFQPDKLISNITLNSNKQNTANTTNHSNKSKISIQYCEEIEVKLKNSLSMVEKHKVGLLYCTVYQ